MVINPLWSTSSRHKKDGTNKKFMYFLTGIAKQYEENRKRNIKLKNRKKKKNKGKK